MQEVYRPLHSKCSLCCAIRGGMGYPIPARGGILGYPPGWCIPKLGYSPGWDTPLARVPPYKSELYRVPPLTSQTCTGYLHPGGQTDKLKILPPRCTTYGTTYAGSICNTGLISQLNVGNSSKKDDL